MNHSKWELPVCPYCGKKLGFWEAWLLRTQGEYTCTKCARPSNIKFQRLTYGMAAIVSVLGLGILLLCSLLMGQENLWGALLVITPFLFFIFLSPRWMYLEAFQPAAPRQAARPAGGSGYGSAVAHTTVIPPVRPQPQQARPPQQRSVGDQTMVMPPVGRGQPRDPNRPAPRGVAQGRPANRPAPSSGARPQNQAGPRTAQNRPAGQPPRQGGVRPAPARDMRQTPPVNHPGQERPFVPPPRKRPAPTQDAQSILNGMTGRDEGRRPPRS